MEIRFAQEKDIPGIIDLLQQVGSGCLHVDFPPGVACSLTGFSEWSYLSHGTWDLS